jgi:hypothetical protein
MKQQTAPRQPADNPRAGDTPATGWAARLAPLAGAGFAVLTAAAFFVIGPNPDSDAPASKITTFYAGHHGHLYLGGILLAYAAILFALFGVAIWERIRRTQQHPIPAGVALVGTAVAAASQLAAATTYFTLGDIGNKPTTAPAALQALHIIGSELSLATAGGVALLLLAVALAGITARVFPRWLAWPALVIGILQLVIPVGFTAFILFLPWALAASIAMIISPARQAPSTAHQDTPAIHTGHAAANS